jgi:GntP family gluconate:H+ symporter
MILEHASGRNLKKEEKRMTGLPLIFVFIVAIVLMIVMISKFKIHPFISIMCISLVLGIIAGIPIVDHKTAEGTTISGLASVIGSGFSGTFSSIGIVIILGALIGSILEQTGAALKLADMVIHLVGKNNPVLAMELMGWVVSIPVFCDSGFVILNPIRRALVNRTGVSSVSMSVGLATGLYISHVFIPPTPGPIAAANTLGIGNNLLIVMGIGALCSVFPLIAGFLYAKFIGKRVTADDEASKGEVTKTYEELVAEFGTLPSGWSSLAPIIVPIILMALSSIGSMAHLTGFVAELITFLGTPIIALAVGTVFAAIQLAGAGKMDQFYNICNDTLKTVGPILFVTAAGGVLGKVISSSDMVNYISAHATVLSTMGIFFPFLLSAILKSAQGSSTVALTTTAGIVAPLLEVLGFTTPIQITLVCMAIGAGAMTVSHANDSFFWVVTNFGAMTPEEGYKTQTMNTLVMGIAAIIEIAILSLIFH